MIQRSVGVGNAETGQDACLQRLHCFGLRVPLMVMAEQMQHTVDDQMAQVVTNRPSLARGIGQRCLQSDHDIPQLWRRALRTCGGKNVSLHRWKRKHIRRFVKTAELAI